MGFVYVAGPYSHPDASVREARYIALNNFTLWLATARRLTPYSPITHWHEIAKVNDLPKGFEFWKRLNDDMIQQAEIVYVLANEGWKESAGVLYEITYARENGKKVHFWEPQSSYKHEADRYRLAAVAA